ncbi:restriction endonuclease subunit S, partial [Sulfitobacter sp. HI0023]
KTREELRDKLTAASLARLTAPDTTAEDLPTHAAFALKALPALTTRPDQIKTLRQTILNLAVRGKLVEQDPADEPASDLLEQIAEDRDRLSKKGEIKKQKPILPLDDSEVPYEAPENWQWARFNEIAAIQSNLVSPKGYPDMPHIAPDNIEGWTARLLPYVSVKEAGVFSGKHSFSAGSILYSKIRPNLAKVTIVDFDGLCSADMYPIRAHIHREFLVKFMITQAFVDQSVSEDNRVAMPKINQAALSNILIPVPPLAEQHRIVAKVDALMALCDRLEAALTTTATSRTRLLESLLHEALEPVTDTLEAAE